MDALGEAHVGALRANVMATPNASIRFWIITIMLVLVLFGLSTLKLRYHEPQRHRGREANREDFSVSLCLCG